jgi:hypothetical protein
MRGERFRDKTTVPEFDQISARADRSPILPIQAPISLGLALALEKFIYEPTFSL